MTFRRYRSAALALATAAAKATATAGAQIVAGSMDVHWNSGAANCQAARPPPLQVHRYNAQTYVLRENPCVTEEAPFMYLLIGTRRALLIDTGDVADPAVVPLAQTVLGLLPGAGISKLPLLVLHTHGHLDHRRGDEQFRLLPSVEIVGTDLDHVLRYFGFKNWPNGVAAVDLGGRMVDVLPTPGHYVSELSYYDRETGLFFSGDFFLPGRLLIADRAADLASARRVADFIKDRPVVHVLGGHIELDAAGNSLGLGSQYHANEHALQMTKADLLELPVIVSRFNGFYTRDGMFQMLSQNRILGIIVLLVVSILLAVGFAIRYWFVRGRVGRITG